MSLFHVTWMVWEKCKAAREWEPRQLSEKLWPLSRVSARPSLHRSHSCGPAAPLPWLGDLALAAAVVLCLLSEHFSPGEWYNMSPCCWQWQLWDRHNGVSSNRECGNAHKPAGATGSPRGEDLSAGGGVVPGQDRVPNSMRLAVMRGGQGHY